jgi:hypothetical protein
VQTGRLKSLQGGSNLSSVYFTGTNTGYIVGQGGTILYTNDAGVTWNAQVSNTTYNLYSVNFFDGNNGYVSGPAGTILKTSNGGNTWYPQVSNTTYDLYSIFFTSANNGCAVGLTGTVRTTTDGGCPAPSVSISGTGAVCSGNSVTLTATGASTYTWSANAGGSNSSAVNITVYNSNSYSVVGASTDGCLSSASFSVTENPSPVVIATATSQTICAGSVTYLSASGASAYSWAPGGSLNSTTAANVTSYPTINTTYTLTGTDGNGCTNIDTITITVNSPPSIYTGGANISCYGLCDGNTTATGSSATYTWSTGDHTAQITNLCAGTYTVSGTDVNGCISTVIAYVTQPPALTAYANAANNVSCYLGNDGSVSVSASGGNAPYTYSWSPAGGTLATTGNSLQAGNYTATVTDANGCTTTATIGLSYPPQLFAYAPFSNISCHGLNDGSATATPSGGTPRLQLHLDSRWSYTQRGIHQQFITGYLYAFYSGFEKLSGYNNHYPY